MLRVNDDFIIRKIYGKVVLMPVRKNDFTNHPVLLNDTAEHIIQIAKTCTSIKELFAKSCMDYQIEEQSENGAAVMNFIQQLVSTKILIETNESYIGCA